MPQFELNEGSCETYKSLSDFAQGYIEAAFFTGLDTGESGAEQLSVDCLSDNARKRIEADCEAFQTKAADLLAKAYETGRYDERDAGRDFWYSRQGHGTGYWDRKALEAGEIGKKLNEIADTFGEINFVITIDC